MNRYGKSNRSRERRQWAKELSEYWQAKGTIDYCELRLPGCVGTFGLAPAHSLDRRYIHTREQYFEVLALCQKCHWIVDREMPKDERERLFKEVIANRELI